MSWERTERSSGKEDSTLGTCEVFTHRCRHRREVREAAAPLFPSALGEITRLPGDPARAAAAQASFPASTAPHSLPVPTWLLAHHTPCAIVLLRLSLQAGPDVVAPLWGHCRLLQGARESPRCHCYVVIRLNPGENRI